MIETDTVQTTLDTLMQPIADELQRMQRELTAFEMKVREIRTRVEVANIDSEQEAVRVALALDQLRIEMSGLFVSADHAPLPQLTTQASARLRHLSTHFRAVAREEQVRQQTRRSREIVSASLHRMQMSPSP